MGLQPGSDSCSWLLDTNYTCNLKGEGTGHMHKNQSSRSHCERKSQRKGHLSSWSYWNKYTFHKTWSMKNNLLVATWCFLTVVLEKTLESPLESKEIKPINPKGNQPWIFIGRTDAEAKAPMLCPSDAKSWLTRKDPEAGKDWGQKEKGQQRMNWLDGITDSMEVSLNKL